ncbi:MAG: cell division protein FtsZ, partial [Anaerolineaceae bacterium]|nr:cell division protein FtsZ [Anaerolineaceae bacterium]
MENNFYQQDIVYNKPVMKVIGLGGGGCNAIDRMLTMGYGVDDVEFIAANTDLQALQRCQANTKILMGPQLTNGLGSGGRPEVGEKAAMESEDVLRKALSGADIVFLTAGMGGGTGSGSISVAAEIARELGAITIAVVST